ncbi:MAG TPA: aquaporin [Deinococcales bacterium]|nr:aquaporin [Deinococcales bacterium]
MPALVAEFIGTFALVFIGAGSIITSQGSGLGLLGIALAHGLTIAVMVSSLGHVSGGHFNPAVSAAFAATGKMPSLTALQYVVAQVAGGFLAALILQQVMPADFVAATNLGTPSLGEGVAAWKGVVLEAVMSFFLVIAVFGSAVDSRAARVGGLFIGLTVALDIMMGGPVTGAAMNPARHLSTALASGFLRDWWVYWVGPVLGGVAAGLVYVMVFAERTRN